MSQVGKVLKMLILLQSRGKMKAKDIAASIDTSKRNIRTYVDDLAMAGIFVMSHTGKYGGYYLEGDNYLYGLNVSEDEYLALQVAQKQLVGSGQALVKDYDIFVEKINLIRKKKNKTIQDLDHYMVKGYKGNLALEKERKTWMDIHASIIASQKIRMNYTSLSSGYTSRVVHPYALYHYKGEPYFAGFCENKKSFVDFKLSRIHEYFLMDEKFEKNRDFSIHEFMKNCIGIYKDTEWKIKLEIQFPMSQIIQEKIWVENQKVTLGEKGSIIYEAKMKGFTEIKSWILGMGHYVKVLEPKELAEDMKCEIKKMMEKYDL